MAAFMPGPRNMHAVKDVSLYLFAYSNEKVVSSNLIIMAQNAL